MGMCEAGVYESITAYAHSRNEWGERQGLLAHLQAVSDLAARFAAPLGAEELGRFLGICHDLGKFHPDFQRYLSDSEAGLRPRKSTQSPSP